MITHEMLQRLPKWAQEHIAQLARERNNAMEALTEFLDNQTPSDFFTESWSQTQGRKRFIQTTTLYAQVGNHEIYISRESSRPDSLYVSAQGGGLIIEPSASNAVRLKVKP